MENKSDDGDDYVCMYICTNVCTYHRMYINILAYLVSTKGIK